MFVVVACNTAVPQAAPDSSKEMAMPKNAQEYVAAFKRGETFTPPAVGVFANGQPDPLALQSLREALTAESSAVREQVVALLVDMSVQIDPLTPQGAQVVRNPEIIALLAREGLAKPDSGREAAMDSLRKLVTPRDLAKFGDSFAKALENAPSDEAFLLVAKSKPQSASSTLEKLAQSPKWKDAENARIARAALGAQSIESQFVAAAASANDGPSLARALGPLALVGTARCLKAIAERLRTPLTIDMPGAYVKSVRLNVLDALLYNFPDQPTLYPNNIRKEEDYTAAEQFCVKTFGVIYTNPPPPFLTYRGYPIPQKP
jgi:hypothetical protein